MSAELILLLVCLAAGIVLSILLLFKIVIEVRKFRKESSESHEKEVEQFKKEFTEKHSKND